jgi:4-hydroxybenzoate polyprenyltransferase
MIYALQDVTIDANEGLHSAPSRLGVTGALWTSAVLHLLAVGFLVAAWWLDQRLGGIFLVGVACVAILLVIEHATVRRWGTARMALAFFYAQRRCVVHSGHYRHH